MKHDINSLGVGIPEIKQIVKNTEKDYRHKMEYIYFTFLKSLL